jgi:hypothetical protein
MADPKRYFRRAEQKLLRGLGRHGSIRESTAWYRYGFGLTREAFTDLVLDLQQRALLDRMDGKVIGSFVLVSKTGVGHTQSAELE